MSKRRKKMTQEERIKRSIILNAPWHFERIWGKPSCELCQYSVQKTCEAIADRYLSASESERNPFGPNPLINNDIAMVLYSVVWTVDFIRSLDCSGIPACVCGWVPMRIEQEEEGEP